MSRFFCFCLTIFFAVSMAHAQSIEGKWKGEMPVPNGAMELTFNFNVNADSLTGSVETQMGKIPFSKSKLDGQKFSFDVSFNEMTIGHQCTVMGDSISMKVEGFPGEPGEIILKRVPTPKKEAKEESK